MAWSPTTFVVGGSFVAATLVTNSMLNCREQQELVSLSAESFKVGEEKSGWNFPSVDVTELRMCSNKNTRCEFEFTTVNRMTVLRVEVGSDTFVGQNTQRHNAVSVIHVVIDVPTGKRQVVTGKRPCQCASGLYTSKRVGG